MLFFDRKTNKEIGESFTIDSFNTFVSNRLSNIIQSSIIDKGLVIRSVISDSADGILIPNELYNPDKRDDFYTLNYPSIPQGKIICETSINALNATLIYSCKKWIYDFFSSNYPQVPVLNSSSEYLHHVLNKKGSTQDIHLIIKNETFDIIKLKNKRLFSFNSVSFSSMTDVIYFLIAHIQKLNLHMPSIQVYGNEKNIKELESVKNKIETLKQNKFFFGTSIHLLELIT
jgi:hypothetical protein